MIDLIVVSCKRCGATYNGDNEEIKIGELEQVFIITKRVGTCIYCPPPDGRTGVNSNYGPDFDGWDTDAWKKTKGKK